VLGAGSTGFSKEPSSDAMENKDKSKQNEHDSGMFQVKEISKTNENDGINLEGLVRVGDFDFLFGH
jgi:hypothetical protein